ncbi:hypothetical protein BUY40_02640 [Staphylococcus cohnii]|nr:hypothetical protein BUY40_02640 [Staphylococcus cohnii]PTF24696.1 hypothetical protein BUY30_05645 [Staphylococcus cohnii]
MKKHTKISYEEIYDDRFFHSYFIIQYFVLLAHFLWGQLQPIVFSLSYSLKRLAKIQRIHM